MKQIKLTVLFSFLAIFTLQAQTRLGIKAGGNLTNFSESDKGSSGVDYNNKVDFHAGVFAQIEFSEKIVFQPELMYSRKGTNANPQNPNRASFEYNFNYLSMPLLVGYKPIENFSILLGPEIGYLLSARKKGESFDNDAKDVLNLNELDLGLAIGLDYQLENRLGFGIRYIHGLSTVYTRKPVDITWIDPGDVFTGSLSNEENKWRNSAFQIYVSYAFLQ